MDTIEYATFRYDTVETEDRKWVTVLGADYMIPLTRSNEA